MEETKFYERVVVTCEKDCPLADVARLMRDNHIGDVIVVERREAGRVPVGIITDRDIAVSVVAERLPVDTLVAGEVMSDDLVTINEGTSSTEMAVMMRVAGVRRLPVVDGRGILVGVVSSDDVLEWAAQEVVALSKVSRHQRKSEQERRAVR